MSKMFTLQDYIEHRGATVVARDLSVDEQTVYFWKHKRSAPKPVTAEKLISLSGGLLTWAGIYQPYCDANNIKQLSFDYKD
jgi:hypothetical protein